MQLVSYSSRSVQLFVSIYFVIILFVCLFDNVKLTSATSTLAHDDHRPKYENGGGHRVNVIPDRRYFRNKTTPTPPRERRPWYLNRLTGPVPRRPTTTTTPGI